MSELVTGEAVPLEMRLAKMPSRALGLLVDLVALAMLGIIVFVLLEQVVPDVDEALASALVLAGTVALWIGVPTTIETLTRGKSLGKAAMGLRVVRDDGGPVRFRHAFIRALAGVFADFVLTLGAGAVICSLLNERGKRIGDILAGTVVVRERIPDSMGRVPAAPAHLGGWAATLDISRLPNDLALAARNYLARADELAPHVQTRLGADLATSVAAVVSPPPPPATSAGDYLAAVLAERHRRDSIRLGTPAATPVPPPTPPRAAPSGASAVRAPAEPPAAPPAPAPPPEPGPATADTPAPRPPRSGGFKPPE